MNSSQWTKDDFYRKIPGQSQYIIQNNIKGTEPSNIRAVKLELKKLYEETPNIQKHMNFNSSVRRGGKRRRRTMKKRNRRTRKMRGGYIYSASKELDKASSVVSASGSKSKSKKRRHSRRS